jgi:hypothetical protein
MRWIAIAVLALYLGWVGHVEYLNYVAWDAAAYCAQSAATWALPTPVPDTSEAILTGPRVARSGLSVQMPGPISESGGPTDTMSVTRLINGGTVIFFPFQPDDAAMLRQATPLQARTLTAALDSETMPPGYDLLAAAMQATPAEVKWWAGRARNTHSMILLMNKAMAMGYADSIHPVSGGPVRGFQFGDPSVTPYVAAFHLFDARDRHYVMVISGQSQGMPVITQAQINAVLSSIRTTP